MATKKAKAKKPARKTAARGKPQAARRTAAGAKPESAGIVRGMHGMFYSAQAGELRAFLRDKLGLKGTDVGGGWLIFNAPEADLGVHPTENGEPASGTADVSFYCDDIQSSVRALKSRGVEFSMEPEDHGYGFVARFRVPGGFDVQLYQPKYRK